MKTVIVLGSGNSGAGAIHDYLLSRKDFHSPFSGKEFRIVNDPDGIHELYYSLYKNFSVNGSANAIYNFKEFIRNSYYQITIKIKYSVKILLNFRYIFRSNIPNEV